VQVPETISASNTYSAMQDLLIEVLGLRYFYTKGGNTNQSIFSFNKPYHKQMSPRWWPIFCKNG